MLEDLLETYTSVRAQSASICESLQTEDFVIQTCEEVSPPKWHLAHTTWFFETFVLQVFAEGYEAIHPTYHYLFNSYYETVGRMHPRPQRGLLSRPTTREVFAYRAQVDGRMADLLQAGHHQWDEIHRRITLGIHHEQQHQELLLMDIKHNFWWNPLRPALREQGIRSQTSSTNHGASGPSAMQWLHHPGGLVEIGAPVDKDRPGRKRFSFDNERPVHKVYLNPYSLGDRLVTNGEYLEFIESGCYSQPEWWLSDGWAWLRKNPVSAPLYWERRDDQWSHYTLDGMRPLQMSEPVCHVSFYEADAYARWKGCRLPREEEWETAVGSLPDREWEQGNFLECAAWHPLPASLSAPGMLRQWAGDLWEWTSSPYTAYPGFEPFPDSFAEYNGKFMCNQMVLRGGCCATPRDHFRPTYRNFFLPANRWPFTGIRLARDL